MSFLLLRLDFNKTTLRSQQLDSVFTECAKRMSKSEYITTQNATDNIEKSGSGIGLNKYMGINNIDYLVDDEFLSSVIDGINNAEKYICILTYMFNGSVRKQILDALEQAGKRGVQVYTILDLPIYRSIVAKKIKFLEDPEITSVFEQDNMHLAFFNQANLIRRIIQVNSMMHSKMMIVDSKEMWIGSHNMEEVILVNKYIHEHKEGGVNNFTAVVKGEVISQGVLYFSSLWRYAKGEYLELLSHANIPSSYHENHIAKARLVHKHTEKYSSAMNETIISALTAAEHECIVMVPYFMPSDSIMSAFLIALNKGINVKILIPETSDTKPDFHSARVFFKLLSDCGAEIRLGGQTLGAAYIHTKIIKIDHNWSFFGSMNLDIRSVIINEELDFDIISEDVAKRVDSYFNEMWERATPAPTRALTTWEKMYSNFFGLFYSIT